MREPTTVLGIALSALLALSITGCGRAPRNEKAPTADECKRQALLRRHVWATRVVATVTADGRDDANREGYEAARRLAASVAPARDDYVYGMAKLNVAVVMANYLISEMIVELLPKP